MSSYTQPNTLVEIAFMDHNNCYLYHFKQIAMVWLSIELLQFLIVTAVKERSPFSNLKLGTKKNNKLDGSFIIASGLRLPKSRIKPLITLTTIFHKFQ
ncbi:hypothetical protein ViNHUV68_14910 [Vibrio sp. NH-UV-68]